jgi:zinc transport system ATP-binding protein
MPMTRSPRRTADPAAPPVRLVGGDVSIGGRPVLRHLDLRVEQGEFVALMGANGSGKSTLVRALTGLRPLAAGTVELFGTPLDRFSDWQRVGFVPQRTGATSGVPASVREVVAAGRLTRRRLLRPLSRADRAAIDDALEVVGLSDRANDGCSSLSGGQQQRALIARALAGEPELFFLDEPTAGVDLPNQVALARALGRLKERGATVVLVAHELGPLAGLVDRAVVMRDGRIGYDGPPLADHEVHHPDFGGSHAHHHHDHDGDLGPDDGAGHHDHAPHVASPLDTATRGHGGA